MNLALIVAAGRGTRLRGPVAKQFLPLGGRPLLAHTLLVFDKCPLVAATWLVVAAGDIDYCRQKVIQPLGLSKPLTLVAGGASRQESVYRGLSAMPGGEHWVIIHDGVRPFVSPAQIADCLASAEINGASTLALPAVDTLKQVDQDGRITGTFPREAVWLAQTPQVFRLSDIRQAHEAALRRGLQGTDDASLMEILGRPVAVVPGSPLNIKITTAEDLVLAEAIARVTSA